MSRLERKRASRKKKQWTYLLIGIFLLWAVFILFMSTRSYQQQTIRPLLIKISNQINIEIPLPDVKIHYAGYNYNLQSNPYGFIEFTFRKSAHVFVYAVLTLLAHYLIRKKWGRNLYSYILPLIFVVTVASIDETLQKFSADRTSSPYDVLLDFTGGCIALLLMILIERISRKRRSKDSSSLIT
ncbi:VanZ family protein [Paenibacillus sp. Sa2BVA9]|uniref:VanZ family protein n=1 Tax=Paenibacillus gallinarum TaxID=2762232 RepID=A0ABR8SSR3_9BACL|nr:VanZ family protein [Paenibacillus gallinarum]